MAQKKTNPVPSAYALAESIEDALRAVKGGADIYYLHDAAMYRNLQALGLVAIVEAMQAPKDEAKRQPYFGCIITRSGQDVLNEAKMQRVGRNTFAKLPPRPFKKANYAKAAVARGGAGRRLVVESPDKAEAPNGHR